ncbi:hypothetical protein SAMN05443637_102216 [Pseudonocardia thermophila]|mgnify:CR=1 FL=1|uniref:Uncharacterized protein n=2 Tax=Pseudonocardia thermophila TaxID=1848 RepID=A0A1M6PE69_PSETH|nr:hypothetical protein SAMN05443637_102216 [Pseudonocardia thermophila]
MDGMTDPAILETVYALLAGSGVAVAVVLLLLGVRRLVQRRPAGRALEQSAPEASGAVEDAALHR